MEPRFFDYWNIREYPHYLSRIRELRLLSLRAGERETVSIEHQGLFYVLNGEITVSSPQPVCTLKGKHSFFVKSPSLWQLAAPEEAGAGLLMVDFEFFASTDVPGEPPVPLRIHTSTQIPFQPQDISHLLFGDLQRAAEQQLPESGALASAALTSILLHTLLLGRQRRDDILQDVGGIAFYSRGNHYHPLEAGREILFSDVRIWSQEPDNPDDEDSPYLLGTLWAHGAEISLPLDGNLTLEPKKELYRGHHTAQIRTLNETPYHVWVWPSLRLHLDLRPHREEYCITFYLKSNMTGNIGFSLTRLNHYNDLPYAIPIPRRDTWIPVCIRNLSFSEYAGSSPYVTSAIFYIYANYSRSIQVKEIADYCHISVPHLSRLFREQTGQTIKDYIAMQRINAAQQMLINTSLPLERIAHAVGFYDTQHLSRTFARYIGMRPNTYRKMRQ